MNITVVKIGTNAILTSEGNIDDDVLANIARGVAELREQNHHIALVCSGSVGLGRKEFDPQSLGRVSKTELSQIRSAVGQPRLMKRLRDEFQKYGIVVAQGLVTRTDFASRERQLAMRTILEKMLVGNILPVVNENDFLTPEELDFSDNDQVASFIAGMLCADRLILLSNVKGLYTGHPSDPAAQMIHVVEAITPEIESYVSTEKSEFGLGGMLSKINSAKVMNQIGIEMVLASSRETNILQQIVAGEDVGTRFLPSQTKKKAGIRVWLAAGAAEFGKVMVDAPLEKILLERRSGVSILGVGVRKVSGDFDEGDAVAIVSESGKKLGRGVAKIAITEMQKSLADGDTKGKIFIHADSVYLL